VATSAAASWLPSFHWITAIRTKPMCTGAFAVMILSLGTAGFATGRYTAEKHARAVTWQRAMDGSPPPRAAMSVRQVVAVAGEARAARPVESVSAVFAEAAQILRSENDRYAWAKAFTTMERLVPEQARDAVEELERYRSESKIFQSLAPLVMALWAQTEPRAALDHALAQYKDVTLALSIEYITRAWAEKDPTTAWAWYRERTDSRRIPISEGTWMWVPATIISEWAAHDAAGAFAEFQRMPFSEQERAIHGIASAALDAQVRPAILAGISALPNEDERRRGREEWHRTGRR
jgi:hypothetical protein